MVTRTLLHVTFTYQLRTIYVPFTYQLRTIYVPITYHLRTNYVQFTYHLVQLRTIMCQLRTIYVTFTYQLRTITYHLRTNYVQLRTNYVPFTYHLRTNYVQLRTIYVPIHNRHRPASASTRIRTALQYFGVHYQVHNSHSIPTTVSSIPSSLHRGISLQDLLYSLSFHLGLWPPCLACQYIYRLVCRGNRGMEKTT